MWRRTINRSTGLGLASAARGALIISTLVHRNLFGGELFGLDLLAQRGEALLVSGLPRAGRSAPARGAKVADPSSAQSLRTIAAGGRWW